MERPAFWKVPRDLHQHQVTESEGGGAPSRPQPAASDSHTEDKPALATLASYSIGFANIGLKGSPLTTRSAEPPPPCFEPQAEAHSLPQQPQHLGSMLQKPNKPAVTALASFALDLADSSQVHAGSPADGVVQRGDLVRKISDYDSRDIRHEDVTTLFKNAGQAIKLVIARESRVSAPPSAPGSRSSSVPPTLPIAPSIQGNDSPYIMASLNPALIDHPRPYCASPHRAELEEEYHMVTDQPYRTTPLVLPGAKVKKDALPTESYLRHHPNPLMRAPPPPHGIPQEVMMKQKVADSVLQRVVGDDPKKKVVSQFNSPIGLYSEENIVNTIAQQTGATPFKKTVVYDPAKSETYKALKESEYGDTIQEIPTPVQPKVFSPAKVNSKATPHRSTAAHSVPGPMHNINSIGANDNIQQSNTFKRLMHMVLEEESY